MGGLGQLVDGQKGVDNFRSDVYGFGKGKSIITSRNKIGSCFLLLFRPSFLLLVKGKTKRQRVERCPKCFLILEEIH